ncbi:excalibur calcium-binding domain-containing protein [Synechococcus sp. CBW1107]|uniref:excalibur calcium-binding domain-containing protein n=1 Tax=Synechococcus sp. CBW1107 TaxID=2789857 RepID=UPI003A0FFBBA
MTKTQLFACGLLGAVVLSAGEAIAQNCSSFKSCKEAVASLRAGNSKLDRDKDGIPCESICGSNGEYMPKN